MKASETKRKQPATKKKKAEKPVKSRRVASKQARKTATKKTQEAVKGKHPGGRPSKKNTINLNKLAELTEAGKTDEELCTAFNICRKTLYNYRKDPQFLHIIKTGKAMSDAKVERSLYERACGYSHADVDIRVVQNQIVMTPITKHYPPDATSMIFWLKNRKRNEWRDKLDHEIGLDAGTIELILSALPPEYAKAVRAKLTGKV